MEKLQGFTHLGENRPHPVDRHRMTFRHPPAQVAFFDVLGHQKRQVQVGRRAEVEHREDVRVRNARQELGLASKHRPAKIGVSSLGNGQNLHADKSFQGLLLRQVDLAHSPLAQKPLQLVTGDRGSVPSGGSMFR